MSLTYTNDLILRAARGEKTPRTPIWMMRQAGRSDPEYNRLKRECGMALGEMFRHPELAARVSLLPKRIGVDAIIYFQDILTPLGPMGREFVFAPGPRIDAPIRDEAAVDSLRLYDVVQELPFIPETFRLIHEELRGELPVLGFAGAPFTLAAFLIEGKSFGAKAENTHAFMRDNASCMHKLLDKLTVMTIDYLRMQIDAQAAAVQLFESGAYLLNQVEYREFALPYQQRIFEALRGTVPTIAFAREWNDLNTLAASGADIISLPSSIGIAEARAALGPSRPIQGNVSNQLVAKGPKDAITEAAQSCVLAGNHQGHIFNLDHGLLSETPFEHVTHLVDVVKATRCDSAG
ncbi:MAG: uroporphyrinogen decarboxylase [Candidatus Hydrogenedentes bacterium]|nr:uroporphyrinogen decarboxylase [Candidatus Hydrogenedentota bacterium]